MTSLNIRPLIRRRHAWLWLIAGVSSCGTNEVEQTVSVRVLAERQQCVIQERQMPCDHVGGYLRDTLHVAQGNMISISVDGTERPMERGASVKDVVRSSGFSRVLIIGFITEPERNKSTP